MARALRIERGGSRYDITARGNERKAIFPTTLTALDSAVVSNAVARVARRLTTNTALAKQLVVIQHQWSKCRDLTLIPKAVQAAGKVLKPLTPMTTIVGSACWLATRTRWFIMGLPATIVYWIDKRLCPDYQSLGIRIIDSDEETRNRFFSLVENALTLISTQDRRRFKRVQRHVQVIANQLLYGRSKYFHISKVCALDLRRFCDPDVETVVPRLATSIVHAATRGMLFAAGIFQTRSNYLRVEELCYRESERFALRIGYRVSYLDAVKPLHQSPIRLRSRFRWFRGELAGMMCKQEREGRAPENGPCRQSSGKP